MTVVRFSQTIQKVSLVYNCCKDIRSNESEGKLQQPSIPSCVNDSTVQERRPKILPTNKAPQNTGENESMQNIEHPSLESASGNKLQISSGIKLQHEYEKAKPNLSEKELSSPSVEFEYAIIDRLAEENKIFDINNTIHNESSANAIIKNIRHRTSHDFEEIDESNKFQVKEQETPKNEEGEIETLSNLQKTNKLKLHQILSAEEKQEHKRNKEQSRGENSPEISERKYSTNQHDQKEHSHRLSEVEDERRIEDPNLSFLKIQKSNKGSSDEAKSSKSIKDLKLLNSFEQLHNPKVNQSYTYEFDQADYNSARKVDKTDFKDRDDYEYDITDIYKFKHQKLKTAPVAQSKSQKDSQQPSLKEYKASRDYQNRDSGVKIPLSKLQKNSVSSKNDENIDNEEEKHRTPSNTKMNKTKPVTASVREEIKRSSQSIKELTQSQDQDAVDSQKLSETKQVTISLKENDDEPLDKDQIDNILDSFLPDYQINQNRNKSPSPNQMKSDEEFDSSNYKRAQETFKKLQERQNVYSKMKE